MQANSSQFKKWRIASKEWIDLEAWATLNKAQAMLKETKRGNLEETKNKTGVLWNRVGDRYSKEFF